MDNRIDIFEILKGEGKLQKIWLYPSAVVENDPYEHTTTDIQLNPIIIDAYVIQASVEEIKWGYYGAIPIESIKIMCELRWESTIKSARRIVINDIEYKTLFDDQRGFAILKRENYLVVVLVRNPNA